MRFTDSQRNTQIELIDMWTCKLYVTNGPNHLEGANRLLNAHVRRAPLDGGNPMNFVHELRAHEGCILIKGDIFEIIQAICDIDRISEQLRNQIIEMITGAIIRKARSSVTPIDQPTFTARLRSYIDTPLEQLHHSPSPFLMENSRGIGLV